MIICRSVRKHSVAFAIICMSKYVKLFRTRCNLEWKVWWTTIECMASLIGYCRRACGKYFLFRHCAERIHYTFDGQKRERLHSINNSVSRKKHRMIKCSRKNRKKSDSDFAPFFSPDDDEQVESWIILCKIKLLHCMQEYGEVNGWKIKNPLSQM